MSIQDPISMEGLPAITRRAWLAGVGGMAGLTTIVTHGVNGYGKGAWCGQDWDDIDAVTNDRERVSCPGCREAASERASDATVEAEIRRACAVYPEIGEVVFEYDLCSTGRRHMVVNGRVANVRTLTYRAMIYDVEVLVEDMVLTYARAQPSCGVCRGSFSLLCHACKGGVGS